MKKTECKKCCVQAAVIFFALCLVFLSGCGITSYFSLNAASAYHVPEYSTTDYTSKYFEFRTASNSDSGDYTVLGTAVYYKIYSSSSTLLSHNSAISAVNTTSNGSSAATKVIETYAYQQLGTTAGSQTPLIRGSSAQTVYIRLMNYGTSSDYSAKVTIAGVEQLWDPLRYDSAYTFDFGRSDNTYANYKYNVAPKSGDDDVYGTSTPSDGVWYVNMYAISVGRDASYTNYYSLVTWLGTVAIDADEKNN